MGTEARTAGRPQGPLGQASVPHRSRRTRVRIAATDRVVQGAQTSLLVGPIDLPAREDLVRAFVSIAAIGPASRLGLTMAGDGTWAWHGDSIAARVDEIVRTAPVAGPQTRQWLVHHQIAGLPIQIAVSGSYLALVADHGLLDAHYAFELPGILVDVARGGPIPALFSGLTARPLTRAILHTWGFHPRRWLALARTVRTQHVTAPTPASRPAAGAPPVELVPASVRVSAGRGTVRNVHAVMDAPRLGAFRQWAHGRVTFAAGVLLLAAAALRSAGIEVAPRGVLVTTVRRYLPAGTNTLGNFIVGINLPLTGPEAAPDAVEARLQDGLAVGKPLAALALAAARVHLAALRTAGRRRAVTQEPVTPPAGPRAARLSVSNLGLLRSLSGLPWLVPPGERVVEAAGDATDPAGVGLITYVIDGCLHLVVSFREDGFDPETVRRCAAGMATRPVELMTQAGYTAERPEEAA